MAYYKTKLRTQVTQLGVPFFTASLVLYSVLFEVLTMGY
jgi:hypothetical protein